MSVTRKRGRDIKIYFDDTGEVGDGTWTEVTGLRDRSLPASPKEVDMTAGDDAWELKLPGDNEEHIEFSVIDDSSNTSLTTLLTLADSGTVRGWAFANGPIATVGTKGVRFDGFLQLAGETAGREEPHTYTFRAIPAPTDNADGCPPQRFTISV